MGTVGPIKSIILHDHEGDSKRMLSSRPWAEEKNVLFLQPRTDESSKITICPSKEPFCIYSLDV
jgi:hypothetical protein